MSMQSLAATKLLDIWERGRSASPDQRALWLLSVAQPEHSLESIGTLRIGQRDAQLMTLREHLFGSELAALSDCPECHLRVQLNLDLANLRLPEIASTGAFTISQGNYEVRCQLPNSFDLIAAAHEANVDAASQTLLKRCILSAEHENQPCAVDQLPLEVLDAIEAQMEQCDLQAQVQLALTCPECNHTWLPAFDIVTFLWREIDAWAARLLMDVHSLASAYGWSEEHILALSAYRRQTYLDLINA